jgi:putative DNA primase/helicase
VAVIGKNLLDALTAVFRRYLILPQWAAEALALWVVHTYAMDAAMTTPRLALTSPQKRCAKTRVLAILLRLVLRALAAGNISPAGIFRTIDAVLPSLLIDEADNFLRNNLEARGILNAGHTPDSAYVIRAVENGEDFEPRMYSTFTPLATASIGKLSDTHMDRAIEIKMRRKRKDETVERYTRKARSQALWSELPRQCVRWVADNLDRLKTAEPLLPESLDDRAADNWEPLLAIAEAAGNEWALKARAAAVALSGGRADNSLGIMLLNDLHELFGKAPRANDGKLFSADIVKALLKIETRPWSELGRDKRPLTQVNLASLLRQFDIVPTTVKIKKKAGKGYKLDDCVDAFERYLENSDLPENPSEGVTPLPSHGEKRFSDFPGRYQNGAVTGQNGDSSYGEKEGNGVTGRKSKNGARNIKNGLEEEDDW